MLVARTPLPVLPAEPFDGRIGVLDRTGLGLASVLVRKTCASALARRVHEHFALQLPLGAQRASSGPVAFAGIGPGAWLASCEDGHKTFAKSLSEIIGEFAAVSDQSDGYAIVRLSGVRIPTILSKLVPLDFDARAFRPDHVAATVAAHVRVVLWRLPDTNGSLSVFELAIPRSFVGSFWDALLTSASHP